MVENQIFPVTSEVEIPKVGLGTYLISNQAVPEVVVTAIRAGYRHVDTAEGYGNEEGVGAGVKAGMAELGIARDELFITTKLWPGNEAWGQTPKTFETTIDACDDSLERLQLDYVDLYLIHAPFNPAHRLEQWRALVELKKQGKVRSIGVSNFNESHVEEIVAAGMSLPEANQIELHPWSQKPDLVSYLREKAILPMAYSSLIPLSTWRDVEGQDSAKTDQMKVDGRQENSDFTLMAEKYGVTESQVLLRWALQKGYPVIPKSTKPQRLRQNVDLFGFALDEEDMAAITTMDRGDGVAWAIGDPSKVA